MFLKALDRYVPAILCRPYRLAIFIMALNVFATAPKRRWSIRTTGQDTRKKTVSKKNATFNPVLTATHIRIFVRERQQILLHSMVWADEW